MKNQIIKDYGKTVTPELYLSSLQGHQYIPQSDQCIKNVVSKKYNSPPLENPLFLLDVGCGPNRLTSCFADTAGTVVAGVDVSESFIKFSKENLPLLKEDTVHWRKNPTFFQLDFAQKDQLGPLKSERLFDVIVMQGVMHHIHGEDRKAFWNNSHELLAKDGILIIGDEFIRDYGRLKLRKEYVLRFYMHIIDEARKGGFNDLAEEEAKNLIDDFFSETEYAGFGDESVFDLIYDKSNTFNDLFYKFGANYLFGKKVEKFFSEFQSDLQEKLQVLSNSSTISLNRGDYKVSIEKFAAEAAGYGFKLSETYKFGPVDQLGGMGVLVFKK